MLYGYILICRKAEGVHGKRKVGNPCFSVTAVWPQARSQALRFGVKNTFYGGKIFVFILCLKQIFMGTTKFGVAQKNGGTLPPNAPVTTGLLHPLRSVCPL